MTTRADIVAEARTWLGTRWQHQASTKGVGSDCIGLVVGVGRELGIPEAYAFAQDLEVKGYGREPDPRMLLAACGRYLDEISTARTGDIILLIPTTGAKPQHFALVSERGYMIHAFANARRVVENRIDDVWRSRIVRAYSYRGIA